MKFARSCIAACTMAALSTAALAVDVPFSGTLTANDPVFNRPLSGNPPTGLSSFGTAVSYDVFPFYVIASTTYLAETLSASFSTDTPDDTFIAIYQTAFNPALPLNNAVIADDDLGVGNLSRVSKALAAGTQYFLIVTSFDNGQFGNYTGHLNSVAGDGQVVLGTLPVPEPPIWAMMLAPIALVAVRSWRRKSA